MRKILLVEDDPFLVDIYKRKFKKTGFDVLTTSNGKEAIKLAKKEKADLLILDIVLPGVEGWEVLKAIKSDPKTNSLKVVVLSNLGQKEEVEKGMELGATKYLIKAHYTPSEVVKEVKKIL
jgi:two-component system phosphate regulon response regulator PhoB/two-component system alkaline phosphatase synthesis response regulator PhoP